MYGMFTFVLQIILLLCDGNYLNAEISVTFCEGKRLISDHDRIFFGIVKGHMVDGL